MGRFFNFIAFLVFKLSVANTIGTGLILPNMVNSYLTFAVLIGAVTWNLITWYYGLPSSSSHALIGGMAGAALAKGDIHALELAGFTKVIAAIILSPMIGLLMGSGLTLLITRLTKHNTENNNQRGFKHLQLISAALLSLTPGGNDAQKTMGIITIAGVGLSQSFCGIHWPIMRKIFLTWVLTIPATALIAAGIMLVKT